MSRARKHGGLLGLHKDLLYCIWIFSDPQIRIPRFLSPLMNNRPVSDVVMYSNKMTGP